MSSYHQLVLQALALAIPASLLLAKRDKALLAWICFSLGVEVFDSGVALLSLEAARWAALLALPKTIGPMRAYARTAPMRVLLLQVLCLVAVGVVFGFMIPWPVGPYPRPLSMTPQWRTLLYLFRVGLDVSLALLVAQTVRTTKRPDLVVRYFLFGTACSAVFAVGQAVAGVDWYQLVTGRPPSEGWRLRGLNFEPKSLGHIAVYGLLLSLVVGAYRRTVTSFLSAALHLVALILSGSSSALASLALAAPVALLVDKAVRRVTFRALPYALALVAAAVPLLWQFVQQYALDVAVRLNRNLLGVLPRNFLEAIAFRLDLFDASALSFFSFNHRYLFTGTGPGLVFLPATDYVPPIIGLWWVYDEGVGLVGMPTHGILIELSNTGLAGVALWLLFVWFGMKALRQRVSSACGEEGRHWRVARCGFAIAASIYFMQSLYSPIWQVFMGLALAAGRDEDERKYSARSSSPAALVGVGLLRDRPAATPPAADSMGPSPTC